ncbi:Similar to Mannan endo-1,6-alpha-mannosidase DCW1; acc. no. P36091 [Pyronema omphalodes CBS 100304]|uniref:Mannan endo-1,6-alpha-mannosidase n=1 Tax=Pyronema omphalodes (strain CBS 100304) TaxID=1076935 RepID=U4KVF0_PYROM|nr:Similar to Mannan endo-1,6-alpha-mannosidase DCW1; acc. no. P36091 [Pyronema omphalodes CBS 100304]
MIAEKLMTLYPGDKPGGTPGLFGEPYYWWEAGAAFGALVDYQHLTRSTQYQDVTTTAILHQVGPDINFQPPNQTHCLGNDDQVFWAFASLTAAETNFPDPPPSSPQWLSLAQAVFNIQSTRWDPEHCGGGLRWQVYNFNRGWDYKNSVSNGGFFLLGARLAKYTGNGTYAEWAEKTWDWSRDAGLIDAEGGVRDGMDVNVCKIDMDGGDGRVMWSYNAGIYLAGAAVMWDVSEGPAKEKWKSAIDFLLPRTLSNFFDKNGIMFEPACEPYNKCNVDQRSFKGYLSRFLSITARVAPFTASQIMPLLKSSAVAAVKSCAAGPDGNTCGLKWYSGGWDGNQGVGEQLSALETVQSCLTPVGDGKMQIPAWVTEHAGGTSRGDPNAGMEVKEIEQNLVRIDTKDEAGAWILTVITIVSIMAMAVWVSFAPFNRPGKAA